MLIRDLIPGRGKSFGKSNLGLGTPFNSHRLGRKHTFSHSLTPHVWWVGMSYLQVTSHLPQLQESPTEISQTAANCDDKDAFPRDALVLSKYTRSYERPWSDKHAFLCRIGVPAKVWILPI